MLAYALCLLHCTLFSCQQDEHPAPDFSTDPEAVRINATVSEGGAFTRSNPLGTAQEQSVFNNGDRIGLKTEGDNPVVYTTDGTNWTPVESDEYLRWKSDRMNFIAYYPARVNNASATDFAMPRDQSTEKAIVEADYMTFTGSLAKSPTKAIDLAMERRMARLVVHIVGFKDQYSASTHSVTRVDVTTNTVGYSESKPAPFDVWVSPYKHSNGDYYALLSPTTADPSLPFLHFEVTRTADGFAETVRVKGIPALEAGMSYTYNVAIGKDMIYVNNVVVNEWTTGKPIDGGRAE